MKKRSFIILLIISFISLNSFASGKKEASSETNGKLKVFVTIPPQKSIVEALGGDMVEVYSLTKEDGNPHTFSPTPSQISELSQADIYFSIGINFEDAFMDKLRETLPKLKIVESASEVELLQMVPHHHEEDGEEEASHEKDESQEKPVSDPHVWTGIKPVNSMAAVITRTLQEELPGEKALLQKNLDSFYSRTAELDRKLQEWLNPYAGNTVFVFHPAFGYFLEAYGLVQEAVETGGKEPTPRQMEHIIDEAIEDGVKIILVQPQFSQKSARIIADACGAVAIPVNQLQENWFQLMEDLGSAVKNGFE